MAIDAEGEEDTASRSQSQFFPILFRFPFFLQLFVPVLYNKKRATICKIASEPRFKRTTWNEECLRKAVATIGKEWPGFGGPVRFSEDLRHGLL